MTHFAKLFEEGKEGSLEVVWGSSEISPDFVCTVRFKPLAQRLSLDDLDRLKDTWPFGMKGFPYLVVLLRQPPHLVS